MGKALGSTPSPRYVGMWHNEPKKLNITLYKEAHMIFKKLLKLPGMVRHAFFSQHLGGRDK